MPRRSAIHYSARRKAYISTIRGEQHTLQPAGRDDRPHGPDYLAALAEFNRLMQGGATPQAPPGVGVILDRYLEWLLPRGAAATYALRRRYLQSFLGHTRAARAPELRPHHLSAWLESHPEWGPSARAMAFDSVHVALNWAVEERLLDSNPVRARKRRPQPRSRGAESLIPPEVHERLLAATAADPVLSLIVRCLHASGCRPHELLAAEAADFRWAEGCLVCPAKRGKRRSSLRQPRDSVVFLPDGLLGELRLLAGRHPEGPVLRTRTGLPWTAHKLSTRLGDLRAALGLPKGSLTAYGYRHTYATDYLLAGGSIATLAQLLNTSVGMIERHYGHLDAYRSALRAEAARCRYLPDD